MAESRLQVPTSPFLDDEHLGVGNDKHGLVPIVTVQWKLKSDGTYSNATMCRTGTTNHCVIYWKRRCNLH